jgi:hypothetical protein
VTLTITAVEASQLPSPPAGPGVGGTIKRLFGRRR